MDFLNTRHGIHTTQIGSVTVYTARLRFKHLYNLAIPKDCRQTITRKGYIELSYETTSQIIADFTNQELGKLCKEVAKIKLEKKYSWVK